MDLGQFSRNKAQLSFYLGAVYLEWNASLSPEVLHTEGRYLFHPLFLVCLLESIFLNFFSRKLSYYTLRSTILEMLHVHAELIGLSFAVHCFSGHLGCRTALNPLERAEGETKKLGISLGITQPPL